MVMPRIQSGAYRVGVFSDHPHACGSGAAGAAAVDRGCGGVGAVGEDGAAGVFARVHGGVGGPQHQGQVRGAGRVGGGGADRDADVDQVAVADVDGLGERGGELVQAQLPARRADPYSEGELVSSEAADDAAAAGPCGEPVGGRGEHAVADGVPVRVVDLLEMVDVADQDHRGRRVAGGQGGGPGGVAVAPMQAGERVAAGGRELAVQADGVNGPAGQRHRGRGDDECAGRLP